jgi:cytochrome c oxidase assembly protein subunit 15
VRLWVIFGLGALLGIVGWWMVASGLSARVSVSQYRLALHLTLACVVYSALVWTAQRVSPQPAVTAPGRVRAGALGLAGLVLLQIYLGALVAGLDAGLTYNTWPLIDGALIPSVERLFFETPLWRNFFENALTVQFVHRMVAYPLWLLALAHAYDATLRAPPARARAWTLAAAITLQAGLGIVTLLQQAPLALALAHQAMAIVVLTLAIIHAARLKSRAQTDIARLEAARAKT